MPRYSSVMLALALLSAGVIVNASRYPVVWEMSQSLTASRNSENEAQPETSREISRENTENKPEKEKTPHHKKRWQPSEELIIIPPEVSEPALEPIISPFQPEERVPVITEDAIATVTAEKKELAQEPAIPFPDENDLEPIIEKSVESEIVSPRTLPLPKIKEENGNIGENGQHEGLSENGRNTRDELEYTFWEPPPQIPDESNLFAGIAVSSTPTSSLPTPPTTGLVESQPRYANQVVSNDLEKQAVAPLPPKEHTPRDLSEALMQRPVVIGAPANSRESWLTAPVQ